MRSRWESYRLVLRSRANPFAFFEERKGCDGVEDWSERKISVFYDVFDGLLFMYSSEKRWTVVFLYMFPSFRNLTMQSLVMIAKFSLW